VLSYINYSGIAQSKKYGNKFGLQCLHSRVCGQSNHIFRQFIYKNYKKTLDSKPFLLHIFINFGSEPKFHIVFKAKILLLQFNKKVINFSLFSNENKNTYIRITYRVV